MNIQSWSLDNCKCIVYTENGIKYYDVTKNLSKVKFTRPVKEIHCKLHIKKSQAWFDEIRKTNNDLIHKYFPIGIIINRDNPSDREKIRLMDIEKKKMKEAS